jgi:hypothetical protein
LILLASKPIQQSFPEIHPEQQLANVEAAMLDAQTEVRFLARVPPFQIPWWRRYVGQGGPLVYRYGTTATRVVP